MTKDKEEEIPQYTEQEHQAMIAQFYERDKPSHTFADQEARLQKYANHHKEIAKEKRKEQNIQKTVHAKRFDDYFKNEKREIPIEKEYCEPTIADNEWLMQDFNGRLPALIKSVKKERNKMLRAEMKKIKQQLEMVA